MQISISGKHQILLRSSWQTVNIGDIAHTFGMLQLMERYLPGVEVVLWPMQVDRGVRQCLQKAFPKVRIVEGSLDERGGPDNPALAQAMADCDLMVHGSGPGVVLHDLDIWRQSGKPYFIFGVTINPQLKESYEGGTLVSLRQQIHRLPEGYLSGSLRTVLSEAERVFCRDTLSLEYLRAQGVATNAAFGPDASFGCQIAKQEAAVPWLHEKELKPKTFICVVPRLRWTPYHRIYKNPVNADEVKAKTAINQRTCASDHAPLRELITLAVRERGLKVLLGPEMTYAVELAREQLFDPLPDDVKANVVWLDRYWLHDEAAAVYAQACAVVSLENHSPILALAQGTPAFYIRQPTDTIKGQMWRDIGADDWFFEIEDVTGNELWTRLRAVLEDGDGSARKVHELQRKVDEFHCAMIASITNLHAACHSNATPALSSSGPAPFSE